MKLRTKVLSIFALTMATMMQGQNVIDVHSHIITPEFVSALEGERPRVGELSSGMGRLLDEGFPLPKWNAEAQLKWMNEAGIQTSVLTLAAPQPTTAAVVREANEAAAKLKREHPDRFRFCAALPLPDVDAATEIQQKCLAEEPGVLCLFPKQMKSDSTQFRILEIYASQEAYQHHIQTAHFQKYKQGTLHMVKSLKLQDLKPLDRETMSKIFERLK